MARPALLLLLLLLGLASGLALGSEVDLQKRIIGGSRCGNNRRLYHVELISSAPNVPTTGHCGGSLIKRQWILTAAHCWDPAKYTTLQAVIGVHPGNQRKVVTIRDAPLKYRDSFGSHDIMLVKLPSPNDVPASIPTIALPSCINGAEPHFSKGDVVEIAGFGDTQAGYRNKRFDPAGSSYDLQCARIALVDCTRLKNINYPFLQHEHWLCGQSPNVDTCPGDSGGGVVYNDMIYGVHSRTGDAVYACTEPAGFMRVCKYLNWIVRKTRFTNGNPSAGNQPAWGPSARYQPAGNPSARNPLVRYPSAGNPPVRNPLVRSPSAGNPAAWNPRPGNPPAWNTPVRNPSVRYPSAGNPPVRNPLVRSPSVGNPAAWNPRPGNPPAWNTPVRNPSVRYPSAGNPPVRNPLVRSPSVGNPAAWNPRPGNPSAWNPPVRNPSVRYPSAGNPAAGNPAAGNPAARNPSVRHPSVGNPRAGNPPAGNPLIRSPPAGNPRAKSLMSCFGCG